MSARAYVAEQGRNTLLTAMRGKKEATASNSQGRREDVRYEIYAAIDD
jgi:hypothetical protein